jgi:predicted transposase YbfD/YdcC
VAGTARAERWKFLTLTVACHEGHPPADAIFACRSGCLQPVPARTPCPGPGPEEEPRPTAGGEGRAPGRGPGARHRAVLGQVAADAKSNEIPAVRELLKAFASLAGVVLTIDVLHTQHDTAQLIPGRQADSVMTVKGNMPTLYKQLMKLPWSRIPSASSVSNDHGRRARRTIKVALAPS